MNEYQEALNRIKKYCCVNTGSMLEDDLKTLQELVDKETPKKVKVCSFVNAKGKHIDEYYCGSCDHYIDRIKYENHCFNCGQALDWGDDND